MQTGNGSAARTGAALGTDQCDDTELIRIVQSSPRGSSAREKACTELVRRYEHLVRISARRYLHSPESQDELTQSGYVGLLKAINQYDPAFGSDLASFAWPCISGEIKRHFRDKRWPVHVRRSAQELRSQLRDGTAELTQRLAREPTNAELADYLGISLADLLDAEHADAAFRTLSLDAPLAGEANADVLASVIGREDDELETSLAMDAVWTHIPELPEREQEMLLLRFFGGLSQNEIGSRLGMSQMHVSRLLAHALGSLRERLLADPGGPDDRIASLSVVHQGHVWKLGGGCGAALGFS